MSVRRRSSAGDGHQDARPRRLHPFSFGARLVGLFGVLGCTVTASAPAEETFATTDDGVRIFYETIGSGIPIVLIPGGPGGSSDQFRTTHALLQNCGRLVFMDNRGRGRSDDLGNRPGAYTLENDLKDVDAVRRAIHAERIVVFGYSYGSMVAMAYAARFPEHTAALITSAGVHGAQVWQERNIEGVKRFLHDHYPKEWARIVELHDAGQLTGEGELANYFREIEELYHYNPESETRLALQFEDRHRLGGSVNMGVYRMMIGEDPEWTLDGTLKGVELLPELANFKGPALILGGRFDRICPPSNQFEIAATLPHARLVIFERSGHAPYQEEPLRFLTVVSEFLREVSAKQPQP